MGMGIDLEVLLDYSVVVAYGHPEILSVVETHLLVF